MINSIKRKIKGILFSDFKSFKDSPYKELVIGNHLHQLSIIYPVYVNNTEGIKEIIDNIKYYCSMSDEVKRYLTLIVVDDCSPVSLHIFKNINLNLKHIRIDKDIRWNSGGAKNLGVCYCESSRIITADIDMVFPEETLRACMSAENIHDGTVYVFDEYLYENGKWGKYGVHPNTFFMTKATYLSLNGYDEDFCGYYGDDLYVNQSINLNCEVYNSGEKMLLTEGVSEKVNLLKRKVSWQIYLLLAKKKKLSHSRDMLRFPWHQVYCKNYLFDEK